MSSERCVICKKREVFGFGHNPFPYCDSGSACDLCNATIVIECRRICMSSKLYYHTDEIDSRLLIETLKQSGGLIPLLQKRFPGLTADFFGDQK